MWLSFWHHLYPSKTLLPKTHVQVWRINICQYYMLVSSKILNEYFYVTLLYVTLTARSREDETRNGHRNAKRNSRWLSQVSFRMAHLKRDLNFDHRGVWFAFRRAFRVWSSRERAVHLYVTLKEPYKRDYIVQKKPVILRSLLVVATP